VVTNCIFTYLTLNQKLAKVRSLALRFHVCGMRRQKSEDRNQKQEVRNKNRKLADFCLLVSVF